ncbi:hypothetical protein ACFQHO_25140 [Actinomadura yumaensis]|uniref:hypothetical protein n=1 Tax=Actinomadura yumaensis TaxID=111807 RepID=UPI003615545C
MFASAGWQVITVKYGRLLEELFERPGGDGLRRRIDAMTNPEFQRLLRCTPAQLRDRLPGDDPALRSLVATLDDATLHAAIRNLGGHDLHALRNAFDAIDDSRPTVILAYTVKGYGLASEGHPQNHSALLTADQLADLARNVGADPADPWAPFPADGPEAALCAETAERLRRPAVPASAPPAVPADFGRTPTGTKSTQAALGRALLDLTRSAPDAARRVVTLCPDVSSSTNLGGWVNKVGVWAARERRDWFEDDPETILHWRERPTGQHLELGIAETNLVGLLGELGATWSRWGEPLLPIGVLYDPFVERALEPWSFGIYAGGQSILVGTPSGVTLAPEGGAHQSITTPPSGSNSPAASPTSPRSRSTPSGRCWPPCRASAARTAPRRTCGCRPGPSTRASPPSPTIRPRANAAAAKSSRARTRCCVRRTRPTSRSPRWAPSCPRRSPPRPGWNHSERPSTSSA